MKLNLLEGQPKQADFGGRGWGCGSKVEIGLLIFRAPINDSSRDLFSQDVKCTHIFKFDLKCLLLSDILMKLHLILICLETFIQNDAWHIYCMPLCRPAAAEQQQGGVFAWNGWYIRLLCVPHIL